MRAAELRPGQTYITEVYPNEPQVVLAVVIDPTYPAIVHVTREKYGTCSYYSSMPVTLVGGEQE